MKIDVLSEFSFLVRFPGDKNNLPDTVQLGLAAELVRAAFGEDWVEVVPVFADLLVTLSPRCFDGDSAPESVISSCLAQLEKREGAVLQPRLIEIPACYDEEFAEDLPEIARMGGISVAEAVKLHTKQTYTVYAMGFCAGYAYMGDVPEPLRQPRRSSPRTRIPVGSVAVADFMTSVYPLAMPGGWHLIGRCPLPLFTPEDQEKPTLLQAGDQVRFKSISKDDFYRLQAG